MKLSDQSTCPCQSGRTYSECCQPFHFSEALPNSAEQLMRSRYTAFVLEDRDYLLKTWDAHHCPSDLSFDADCKWLGLKIKSSKLGGSNDDEGWVHFVARYRIKGKATRLEENSYFTRQNTAEGKAWLYVKAED